MSHLGKGHFVKINWLPVADRVGQITAFHVFNIYLNTAPAYMNEHFTSVSDIHNYPIRFRVKLNTYLDRSILTDSKRYTVPVVKGFGIKSFAYSGCTLWNICLNISGIPEHHILLNLGSRNICKI